MRLKPGTVAHLQYLAGVAWKEGNIDEAERLETLARALDMMKSRGKKLLIYDYTRSDNHRPSDAKEVPTEDINNVD